MEMRHAGYIYLHQFAKIKFGSFQNLDFTNENILQWVDAECGLFNLSANHLRNEFLHQLLQITGWSLIYHNFSHLAANLTWDKHKNQTKIIIYNLKNNQHKNRGQDTQTDLTNLTGLGIAGSLDLICTSLSKCNTEHPKGIVISGLDIDMSLNQCLPLSHQWSQLVSGETHPL